MYDSITSSGMNIYLVMPKLFYTKYGKFVLKPQN